MRSSLLLLFWLCVLGTFIQLPLLCYEIWLLATGLTFSELTVWALLTEHLTFLAWIAKIITAVFGAELGGWILHLPVTLVTIVKLISGTLIGYWALNKLREIDSALVL
jgi:hypothetical protein